MKKQNTEMIVESLLTILCTSTNTEFTIEKMTIERTKLVPKQNALLIEIILNKTESEVFFEHKRVKRTRGNTYKVTTQ